MKKTTLASYKTWVGNNLSTVLKWVATSKWQYVYYALATFNLLTVSGSLYLNHKMMDIYTQSIAVNQEWAVRLENYSDLGEILSALNAPGNDIFDSQDVQKEAGRLELAQNIFNQKIHEIRQDLRTQVAPGQSRDLLNRLQAVETASDKMVAEAEIIFAYFRQNQPVLAGKHMATMDRKYHHLNTAMAQFRREVSQIQRDFLDQQKLAAVSLRAYELAIAAAMVVMVMGVTAYGHKLAQKMKSDAEAKEASIAELQHTEILLKQQAEQIQLTLNDLQSTQLQLVQTEKMSSLGEMVAGVAHEINNPVNFIHGNLTHVDSYCRNLLQLIDLYEHLYPEPRPEIVAQSEEMDLEFLQEDLLKLLASMKMGTNRIREIVLSLRNFSRMDEAEFKSVNIHQGIDSTLLILQHRLKEHHPTGAIKIVKAYGSLPEVECYAGQLNQVFMNILSNAIDAIQERVQQPGSSKPNPPGQITIRTTVVDEKWVEIAIADNGTGISEATQQRIFDPFFTTKSVGKGTGLGMSISYQIIAQKHGGQITCLSQPGQGTEFVLRIPQQQAALRPQPGLADAALPAVDSLAPEPLPSTTAQGSEFSLPQQIPLAPLLLV